MYWLKAQTPEFDNKRWWFSNVYVGGNEHDDRVLYVAVKGESGRAFRDYYLQVRKAFKQPLGIATLPKDISLGPHVSVRQTEPTEPDPPEPSGTPEPCGMTINWPPENAIEGTRVRLSGEYVIRPPQDSLLIYEKNEDDHEYWFKQEKPDFNEKKKEWSALIYIGAGKGKRILAVATTGEGGIAARNYCKVVYDRIERWIPVESLPPDVQTLAEVPVSYSGDERLQTKP